MNKPSWYHWILPVFGLGFNTYVVMTGDLASARIGAFGLTGAGASLGLVLAWRLFS